MLDACNHTASITVYLMHTASIGAQYLYKHTRWQVQTCTIHLYNTHIHTCAIDVIQLHMYSMHKTPTQTHAKASCKTTVGTTFHYTQTPTLRLSLYLFRVSFVLVAWNSSSKQPEQIRHQTNEPSQVYQWAMSHIWMQKETNLSGTRQSHPWRATEQNHSRSIFFLWPFPQMPAQANDVKKMRHLWSWWNPTGTFETLLQKYGQATAQDS